MIKNTQNIPHHQTPTTNRNIRIVCSYFYFISTHLSPEKNDVIYVCPLIKFSEATAKKHPNAASWKKMAKRDKMQFLIKKKSNQFLRKHF